MKPIKPFKGPHYPYYRLKGPCNVQWRHMIRNRTFRCESLRFLSFLSSWRWCSAERRRIIAEAVVSPFTSIWDSQFLIIWFLVIPYPEEIPPKRVFGHDSAPWSRRGTRIGGNESYKPPESRSFLNPPGPFKASKNPNCSEPKFSEKTKSNDYVDFSVKPKIFYVFLGFSYMFLGFSYIFPGFSYMF